MTAFDGVGQGEAWNRLTNLGWDKFMWFAQVSFNIEDANYRASMIAAKAVVDVLRGGSSPYVNNVDFKDRRMKKQELIGPLGKLCLQPPGSFLMVSYSEHEKSLCSPVRLSAL